MPRSSAAAGLFPVCDGGTLARLTGTLFLGACVSVASCNRPMEHGFANSEENKGEKRMIENPGKSSLVNFGSNPLAPAPPSIGVAVAFGNGHEPAVFHLGDAIELHGAYQADLDLIRLCSQGLTSSIMVTVYRVDRPWGETGRLNVSKAPSEGPPPAGGYDSTYRESGQFHVDLVKFFGLPPEPAKYFVEAVIGPYVSHRISFEVRR
jgi:hypothetical protein